MISNLLAKDASTNSLNLYLSPPPGIEHFTMGFSGLIADSLWIRVIQDFDYCEAKEGEKICRGQGWVYQVVSSISHLDPHFRMPLYTGGLLLTVIVHDQQGASKIFNRGVELFPNDWPMLYAAGYQAMFEERDRLKAGRLLEAAAKNGAPSWVYALATKMYTEAGEQELGERLYETLKASGVSEEILKPVRERLNH